MNAPVAVFAYKRAQHLQRTLASLAANAEAPQTDLLVFCDAAKRPEDEAGVNEVRALVANLRGFRSVTVTLRESNLGLARSIVQGVSQVLETHEQVIVVEDDLLLSPHFLRYMNDGLALYAADDSVASLHGYCYPVDDPLPETFFLRGADCWGWATWRRAWSGFRADGASLLNELQQRGLTDKFDLDGSYGFTAMLRQQIAGRNDSWAVRWHASCFLAEKLTLYPDRSLVHNIGNDASGTHCDDNSDYAQVVADRPIAVARQPLVESVPARDAFVRFFRARQRSPLQRAAHVLRRWLRRLA